MESGEVRGVRKSMMPKWSDGHFGSVWGLGP